MTHPVNHPLTGKPDKRWKVALEATGDPVGLVYVVRFCGEWITSRLLFDDACNVAKSEAKRRWESL